MRPTVWTRRMIPAQLGALNDMQRQMDRLFGSLQGWENAPEAWTLPADVRETDDALEFTIEIPGLRPEDIDLTVEKDVLSVSGEKKFERAEDEEGYRLTERRFGRFERSFRVPMNVDAESVSANYEHGVLTIHLPKKEEARPRRIKVGAGNGTQIES